MLCCLITVNSFVSINTLLKSYILEEHFRETFLSEKTKSLLFSKKVKQLPKIHFKKIFFS